MKTKNNFEEPILNVVKFEATDIITTSDDNEDYIIKDDRDVTTPDIPFNPYL